MKKLFVFILFFTVFEANAQDTTKVKKKSEYLLTVSGFSPLSLALKYKKQIKNLSYFKLGIVNMNISRTHYKPPSSSTFPYDITNYNAGIEFGFEFRRIISDFLTFYHGPNMDCSFGYHIYNINNPALPIKQRKDYTYSVNPGISYSIGLMGKITKNVLIAFDINPGINYRFSESINNQSSTYITNTRTLNFNFENSFVQLSIVFRP